MPRFPESQRAWVFISYARSDGEQFATDLRMRLQACDIPVWQDRVAMEGGRDWWLQISSALEEISFLVLVMTANALQSETVGREWREARQKGVCVYPVIATPNLDFARLPRWMRQVHFYDLDREWEKFRQDLNTTPKKVRVPFMVEDLAPGFVVRPEELDRLRLALCGPNGLEPVPGTAALVGAGGFGKTTLARAICHDDQMQEVFDDGILWVTLGEHPGNLIKRVEDLLEILGGEHPGFSSIEAASARLSEFLADRDMLIVIDDAWNNADLAPFLTGGARCARLITTRNLECVPAGARRIEVDGMREPEALELVHAELPPGYEEEMRLLALRLGRWPLLLRLVNKALLDRVRQNHQPLGDALAYVNRALDKRGLTAFDARDPKSRTQAVATTLGVSLERLTEPERARFAELAVFRDDVEVPLSTIAKLWAKTAGFDELDAEDLCMRLQGLSLLSDLDLNLRRLRLHDVVRKFLLSRPDLKLPTLHAQLLDAHLGPPNAKSPEGRGPPPWSALPREEAYLWQFLAFHLVEAGRQQELIATVKDPQYLAKKTVLRGALPAEIDLLAARKIAPEDKTLTFLCRAFTQSAHLLNKCDRAEDVQTALFSRLQHLDGMAAVADEFSARLPSPWLAPDRPFPDLPSASLVRTFAGHTGAVYCCAFSPDGKLVATASADRTVRVWETNGITERLKLIGHTDSVTGCAFSPDSTFLVSASQDTTLKVWDLRKGSEQATLLGHSAPVFACAVSPDGRSIVSASDDGTLKIWDRRTATARMTLAGHSKSVTNCAWTEDGARIISASDDHTLKIWNALDGADLMTLAGHRGCVYGCAVDRSGSLIVSASEDRNLKVWDARSGREVLTLHGHIAPVFACAISSDGRFVTSASEDMTLRLWDVATGAQKGSFAGHQGGLYCCALSPEGTFAASASADDTVKLWDLSLEEPMPVSITHNDPVKSIKLSPNGMLLITTSPGENLKVREVENGQVRFALIGHTATATSCAFSPDGTFLVSTSADRTVRVWDARTFASAMKLPPLGTDLYSRKLKPIRSRRFILVGHDDKVLACAVSRDSQLVASASADATIKVWDAKTGRPLATLAGHEGPVLDCAFSQFGLSIISASQDRTLRVWDPRTAKERLTLRGHDRAVLRCTTSPNGAYILSASEDQTLRLWDSRSGKPLRVFSGHKAPVRACAFGPYGSWILSVADDQTVRLWDIDSGSCQSCLYLDGPLSDCLWFPDGERTLVAGSAGLYFIHLICRASCSQSAQD